MKVLYSTPKVRGTSSQMPDGKVHDVEAWFELQLHEGPPDPNTWEGGGKTIGEWREEFKRLRDPRDISVACHGADGIADAVIPNEILDRLPADARVTFVWTVCTVTETPAESGRAAAS
jgi:hypothetical protein